MPRSTSGGDRTWSVETAREAFRQTTGMDFAAQLELMIPAGDQNAELAERFEDGKPDLVRNRRPFPRTLDALARLEHLGVAVFICSSTSHQMVEHFCADTGIADLVDGVSGLRPGHRKLDQLQAAVSATGLRPDQMLFVGDSVHDIDLANQTGTRFAGVTGLFAAEEFARAGVATIADLSELAALVAAAQARLHLREQTAPEPAGPSALAEKLEAHGETLRNSTQRHEVDSGGRPIPDMSLKAMSNEEPKTRRAGLEACPTGSYRNRPTR